ncbi:hypothetical protein GCM10022243_44460 [Saccharothrix violaceirubra]|uniref:Peptidyl-prolyl cis-trans isomerase n=1 Tax=Saccharothrix violaceirubra TaxID=413306 RepID=A0A7W7T153_9PSEU|nr:FKBP-type peptidyl-prolyl cis-trans isomerase [Saccharothrix violaceirubra]MBB4964664.1 peptidylprolyl isomerase [Saccharothrix violaceirubra]
MRTVDRTALVVASLLSAGLALSACTASDRPSTQTTTPVAQAPQTTQAAEETPAEEAQAVKPTGPPCATDAFKVQGAEGAQPTVTVPRDCSPLEGLVVQDITPGTGAAIAAGDTAEIHYTLYTFSDAKLQETSYKKGEPYPVVNVGNAQVIQGWNQGLVGLKEGGRRLLVVPPALAYGDRGSGAIKPGETLVFVLDAVKVG